MRGERSYNPGSSKGKLAFHRKGTGMHFMEYNVHILRIRMATGCIRKIWREGDSACKIGLM
jgi:hypothetical protein